MFTGIVEEVGTLVVREDQTGRRAGCEIRARKVLQDVALGDSIAVNGVCLTVTARAGRRLEHRRHGRDAAPQQPRQGRGQGNRVNLERAVTAAHPARRAHRAGPRRRRRHRARPRRPATHWEVVRIALPAGLARYVVEKGSITVDGVSLTVSAVSAADDPEPWFEVSLIPTTLRETTLGARAPGDPVNLEVDVIAKYVERLLEARR